jgi:hypothetical protein
LLFLEKRKRGEHLMVIRIDQVPIQFPEPNGPSPNGAAAVQELLGGKFGEMSTLMNYTFQSFNFRGRERLRPYYDLICNIAAEEYSHIELVSYAINLLLTGSTVRGKDPSEAPLKVAADARNAYHFIASGQAALPVDSMGNPWNGSYVTATGNLKWICCTTSFWSAVRAPTKCASTKWWTTPPRARWWLLVGARRRPHRGLRQGARRSFRCGREQAVADSRPQQQGVP